MPPIADDWQRLADYVIARREELGYKSRQQFADHLGGRPSLRTLLQLEQGKRVDPNTLAAVQAALRWRPGSARRILSGGEPLPAGDEPAQARGPQRRRFADPALQRVYDAAEGLDENDRLNLVALAEAMRARQRDA